MVVSQDNPGYRQHRRAGHGGVGVGEGRERRPRLRLRAQRPLRGLGGVPWRCWALLVIFGRHQRGGQQRKRRRLRQRAVARPCERHRLGEQAGGLGGEGSQPVRGHHQGREHGERGGGSGVVASTQDRVEGRESARTEELRALGGAGSAERGQRGAKSLHGSVGCAAPLGGRACAPASSSTAYESVQARLDLKTKPRVRLVAAFGWAVL
mmetsp:Transcript_24359/g.53160  ORF Transcript_24359/g.53160 Transcript_24359/m.53160 type:complete len:209 (-) Transcript_24359:500-1126(-)